MGFKENLRQKIAIDRLAEQVLDSWGAPDDPGRIDRQAMEALLALSTFTYQRERDLDLYIRDAGDGAQSVLVLDNELKVYHTSIEDVALRKSPTVKEMVSVRNAIKILNDKDVVVSAKTDTVQRLKQELIAGLDLAHTRADIEAIAGDGRNALENRYADGVIDILTLFAELLGYVKAPKRFEVAHTHIWGQVGTDAAGVQRFGPLVMFSLLDNGLKMVREPISAKDGEAIGNLARLADGTLKADLEGAPVFQALVEAVEAERT
jgi:hypothetical protein